MMIRSKLSIEFRTRHSDPDEPDRAEWICASADGILRSDAQGESVSFSAAFGEGGERSAFRYRFSFSGDGDKVLRMEQTGDSEVCVRFEESGRTQEEYRTMGQTFLLCVETRTVLVEKGHLFVRYDTSDPSGRRTRHEMDVRYKERR